MANQVQKRALFRGCLLGGACGDALGAKVEFMSQSITIFRKYGPQGIRDIGMNYNVPGGITDDTQMTLFTAEGVISAFLMNRRSDGAAYDRISEFSQHPFRGDAIPAMHQSYLRWLKTQGVNSNSDAYKSEVLDRGWLIQQQSLHSRRAPGMTCTRALMSGALGSPKNLINDSKGCGGVMRVAPCALIVYAAFPDLSKDAQLRLAFELACAAAALTHTHPSGWLSAGCLSTIILSILVGDSLEGAVAQTVAILKKEPSHRECLRKIEEARKLAKDFTTKTSNFEEVDASGARQELVLEHIEKIGEGWVGEEALGIALYCCLISQDHFETAICYAVNHGGDSDSTGAIAGNIFGALLGDEAIPQRWSKAVELRDVILELSDDMFDILDPTRYESLTVKYPPALLVTNDGTDLSTIYSEV